MNDFVETLKRKICNGLAFLIANVMIVYLENSKYTSKNYN